MEMDKILKNFKQDPKRQKAAQKGRESYHLL